MFQNSTYKAFVAEAAAKVAASISQSFATARCDLSLLKDDGKAEDIAIASVNVAQHLASKLEDWWQCTGDHATVMFDVEDTSTSRIENELAGIREKLEGVITGLWPLSTIASNDC